MTRKKTAKDDKAKSRKKTRKQASPGEFFHLMMSTPFRQLIMIAIIVVLLAVFWENIEKAIGGLIALFGWGLVFIIAAIVTVIVIIWLHKSKLFIYRWNRWL